MGFDIADRSRCDASPLAGILHHARLRQRVGYRVAVGLAASIDRTAFENTIDMVTIDERLGQRLQQQRAHAFCINETVRVRAERFALIRRRQHDHLRERHVMLRVEYQIDPTCQCTIAHTAIEAFKRQMQSCQRRGTGCINGQARAIQVKQIGDTVSHRPERRPTRVTTIHHADKHADFALSTEAGRGIARILDCGVRLLQEQPLLWIHALGLRWRDMEEQGIKAIDFV